MLGHKVREFKTHLSVSLEQLVPPDNFYRHLESQVDLSFVRGLVKDYYSPMGRPSIDPEVFFKLQLIAFFEGIRSERQLMESVALNLAHRWYIGYDLDEQVPDHSSLSKIRDRYGLEVFMRFFEKVVELCIEADLVWGEELFFDGSKVEANADIDGMVPRFYWEAIQHLDGLFGQDRNSERTSLPSEPGLGPHSWLVEKYDGTRLLAPDQDSYQRLADSQVSPVDPDATPMTPSNGGHSRLGYHLHYVVDGGKARIILAALVTPASIMDHTPMLDMVRWVRFRWQIHPRIAVGDTRYGTTHNIVGLEQDGLRAYLPISDYGKSYKTRTGFFSKDDFQYDAERDVFTCPAGHDLTLFARRPSSQTFQYRAKAEVCHACPLKPQCTASKSGRTLSHSFFHPYLDRVKDYAATEAYKRAMRKRQVWVEPLFGEAKQFHCLSRFRLRRLWKVNIEGVLTAAGQNLKRILITRGWGKRRGPAAWGAALALPLLQFSF
jgi:transposase